MDACFATAGLLANDIHVISPIVHFYPVAETFGLDGSYDFWKEINLKLLQRCDGLIVLTIEGWGTSRGVLGELEHAREWEKPILFCNRVGKFVPFPKEWDLPQRWRIDYSIDSL